MNTKNNWLTTSLKNRTAENLCDFTITINPYKFEIDTFQNNSIRLAKELVDTYSPLYLFYSGGMDSEYILKLFLDNNLPITPVLVVTPFNKSELTYAVNFLKTHNIRPYIIEYKKDEVFKIMKDVAYSRGYYSFTESIIYHACDIISSKGGTVISGCGEPLLGINYKNDKIQIFEYDFYIANHLGNHVGGFWLYDLSLYYSYLTEADFKYDSQTTKSKLYNLPVRPKIEWTSEFYQEFHKSKLNIEKFQVSIDRQEFTNKLLLQEKTIFT
jgi:hypothetical protein